MSTLFPAWTAASVVIPPAHEGLRVWRGYHHKGEHCDFKGELVKAQEAQR